MKRWNWKQTVVAAAVCCLLVGGTVFAAGRIASITSHSRSAYDVTEYAEIVKIEEKAGIEGSHVEKFTNGFTFDGANVVDSEGNDDNGNVVSSWKEIMLTYRDDADRSVNIAMEPYEVLHQDLSADALEERVIADIPVYYTQVEYHQVPPDYEASAEELARQESDPHYAISYGAVEETTETCSNVCFEKDGIAYTLLTFDDVAADALYQMAEEIIAKPAE